MSTVSPVPYIWYKFDTLSTTKVTNSGSAGATLDATLMNGASVTTTDDNPVGSRCLNLTNNTVNFSKDYNGQYVSIPPFTLSTTYSFSCWFKKNVKENDSYLNIFDFGDHSDTTEPHADPLALLFVGLNGVIVIEKRPRTYTSSTTRQGYCDNKWHHLVVINDGTNFVFYIDNVISNTAKITKRMDSESFRMVNNYLGRNFDNGGYSTIQLDDFRVYTTPLTANDIATLFTYKKVLPSNIDYQTIVIAIVAFIIFMIIIKYMFFRNKQN